MLVHEVLHEEGVICTVREDLVLECGGIAWSVTSEEEVVTDLSQDIVAHLNVVGNGASIQRCVLG